MSLAFILTIVRKYSICIHKLIHTFWKGNRRVTQVYNAIAEGRLLSKSKERKSSVKISRRLPNNVFILKDIGPVEVTGRDEEVSTM